MAASTMGGTSGALYSLGLITAGGAAQVFAKNLIYPKALAAAVGSMSGMSSVLYSLGLTAAGGAAQAFAITHEPIASHSLGLITAGGAAQVFAKNPIYPKALAAAVGSMSGMSSVLYSLGLIAAWGAAQAFANPIYP